MAAARALNGRAAVPRLQCLEPLAAVHALARLHAQMR